MNPTDLNCTIDVELTDFNDQLSSGFDIIVMGLRFHMSDPRQTKSGFPSSFPDAYVRRQGCTNALLNSVL